MSDPGIDRALRGMGEFHLNPQEVVAMGTVLVRHIDVESMVISTKTPESSCSSYFRLRPLQSRLRGAGAYP